jgi:hypothetical protein
MRTLFPAPTPCRFVDAPPPDPNPDTDPGPKGDREEKPKEK